MAELANKPYILSHEGKDYIVTNEEPQNGDLVLTDLYGVWVFRNDAPPNSKVCYAPMPYWANKKSCRKIVSVTQ